MLQGILFSMIQKMYPDLAKTITEILLETDNTELLVIMESKESFESKVCSYTQINHRIFFRFFSFTCLCIHLYRQGDE